MKADDDTRGRVRVGMVAEEGFAARCQKFKPHLLFLVHEVPRQVGDVARGLVGIAQEGDAHRLRLYQSAEAPADEQRVVDGTGCRLKFVDHGAQTGALIMSARDRTTRPQSASRVRGV